MEIHRYGFIPNLDLKTNEYSWRKLKVIRVWARPNYSKKGFEVIYILENCIRVSEYDIITEEKTLQMSLKHTHNSMVDRLMGSRDFYHKTIFSPATERGLRGEELEELIKQSKVEIRECIENDIINGEGYLKQING